MQTDPAHAASLLSRRSALRLVLSGAAVTLLAACGPSSAPPAAPPPAAVPPAGASAATPAAVGAAPAPTSPPAAGQQPKSGGTLNVGMNGEITSVDGHLISPQNDITMFMVFDSLTRYDQQRQPQPNLAESWEFSADQKQLKLNLRQQVQFHTGRTLTSDDIKFNMLRVRDPKVGTSQLLFMSNWFTDIQTPDPNTVVLVSDQPRPAVFDFLEYLNIVDPVTIQGPNAQQTAVGTGPFSFVEWIPGDHATFARNKNYWQSGKPYLDQVVMHIFRDPQAMVAQLEGRALDGVFNPLIQDTVRLKQDPTYQVNIDSVASADFVIAMNTSAPPLDNKVVRQALNYAVDRQRFATQVMHGLVEPINLPWPPQSPAYESSKNSRYTFDLDKAKALLQQAGVSNLQFDFVYSSVSPEIASLAQIYQADLATIGVTLNLKPLESAVFNQTTNSLNYTGLAASNVGFIQIEPSSLASLSVWFKYTGNDEAYQSDQYTQLVTSAATEPDATKRQQVYSQLNDLILDESFVILPAPLLQLFVGRSNVNGLDWRLTLAPRYEDIWLS